MQWWQFRSTPMRSVIPLISLVLWVLASPGGRFPSGFRDGVGARYGAPPSETTGTATIPSSSDTRLRCRVSAESSGLPPHRVL